MQVRSSSLSFGMVKVLNVNSNTDESVVFERLKTNLPKGTIVKEDAGSMQGLNNYKIYGNTAAEEETINEAFQAASFITSYDPNVKATLDRVNAGLAILKGSKKDPE